MPWLPDPVLDVMVMSRATQEVLDHAEEYLVVCAALACACSSRRIIEAVPRPGRWGFPRRGPGNCLAPQRGQLSDDSARPLSSSETPDTTARSQETATDPRPGSADALAPGGIQMRQS
jgi:hypothetical protein